MWVKRSPATAENVIGSSSVEASGKAASCVTTAVVAVAESSVPLVIVTLRALPASEAATTYESVVVGRIASPLVHA